MSFVYIDESGDIGSKSKYIVFAAIVTESNRHLEKMMKKIWGAKPQYHGKGRLHSVDVDDATRIRVLSKISVQAVSVHYRYYEKARTADVQVEQYYTELARFINHLGANHVVVVERKDTIKKRISTITKLKLSKAYESVIFGDPHEYKQLQAVDFVAWAYGRFMEQKDETFSRILEACNV